MTDKQMQIYEKIAANSDFKVYVQTPILIFISFIFGWVFMRVVILGQDFRQAIPVAIIIAVIAMPLSVLHGHYMRKKAKSKLKDLK